MNPLRRYIDILHEAEGIPPELASLAKEIAGLSYEAAKRAVVSKTGSVDADERFPDDVADAVFLRLQRNAQVGRYTEEDLQKLGRGAKRLSGDGTITLYRAAPRGTTIRPGDFTAASAHEAGFYTHGGNTIQSITVPRNDVFSVEGSVGGGQEFVYLPRGYVAPTPKEYFASFKDFYRRLK